MNHARWLTCQSQQGTAYIYIKKPDHTVHPQLHSQISKPYKQWWEFKSGGNQQSRRVLSREQSAAQRQQNQGADCCFQEEGGRVAQPRLHQLNSFTSLGIDVTEDLSGPSHITTLGTNENWRKDEEEEQKAVFSRNLRKIHSRAKFMSAFIEEQ